MFRKNKNLPWHEDDNFWRTMFPKMFGRRQFEDASSEVDLIMKLLEIQPEAKTLDLCCGPGRHALELARRGFSVVGLDRTRAYIDRARKQAKKEKLKIDFIVKDMRDYRVSRKFDFVLNLFTSFGYFKKPAEDRLAAKNMYEALKPGGKLLMEMMGKEVLKRIFQARDWREENGAFFLEERKLNEEKNWIESRWIMIKGSGRKEFTISHRLYSGEELSSLLQNIGFKSVKLFGGLDGSPYDINARRLVAVAKKA